MGREASKTNRIREADFFSVYLSGRVIDIGGGKDSVVPHAEVFDREQGDANQIRNYFGVGEFDCVHSSHCLEHMKDPLQCLSDWWSLVKVGGYMITVVPEETLYEQYIWPSCFNSDHKVSFRLGGDASWSPVSINIEEAFDALPDCEVLEAVVQDGGYDYDLIFPEWRKPHNRHDFLNRRLLRNVAKLLGWCSWLKKAFQHFQISLGYPIDQTDSALAQIQVVARKVSRS